MDRRRKMVPLGFVVLALASCHKEATRGSSMLATRRPVNAFAAKRAVLATETRPLSLVAGDGTELELREIDARVVVQGPLAYTELHLLFKNPQDRQMEGRFSIHLPERAAISRLAMMVGKTWQEGEVLP